MSSKAVVFLVKQPRPSTGSNPENRLKEFRKPGFFPKSFPPTSVSIAQWAGRGTENRMTVSPFLLQARVTVAPCTHFPPVHPNTVFFSYALLLSSHPQFLDLVNDQRYQLGT